jgi:CRP/FNR family transcriptional regulator, cyclic AMP receptor protein
MTDFTAAAEPFLRALRSDNRDDELLVVPQWDTSAWCELFAYTQPTLVEEGGVLIRRGVTERSLFFVTSGALEVSVSINDNSLGTIVRILPGAMVGEIAFFDERPRSAKVWAIADSALLRLDHGNFQRYAAAHPVRINELLFALGRLIALRLRRMMPRSA